jgi:hypothetical protein
MKYLLLLACVFSATTLLAQDSTSTVIVHKDPRVELLMKKQADANAAYKKATARSARGFRLLVVNTNKRDEAIAAKTRVLTNFPELKAYLLYQTPYFKLKAGNFRTREEAQQYQKHLNRFFPKGVYIIADTIEVTPEKDSE